MEESTEGIRTILRGVVGSKAYGLDHADSDTDRMEVFAAPALDIAGLDWHSSKDSQAIQGPEGDDFSAHEVGKFVRLALKSNPTVSELLWLDEYEVVDESGDRLIEARKLFLSVNGVRSAYLGYANAQFTKFSASVLYGSGIPKRKHARHCLRLLRQGLGILQTGEIQLKVRNPAEYFAMDDMTDDQVVTRLQQEFNAVEYQLADMHNFAVPDEPDRKEISLLLREIRLNHLT